MGNKLQGKTFIITGGTSGMGKATAFLFAQEGAQLIISGRNTKRGKDTEQEINDLGAKAVFVQGDVRDLSHNQELVQTAIQHYGKLDGVQCHAGMLGLGSITELKPSLWQETFGVNVDAVFYLLKFVIPELLKQKTASVVVNSSIAAFKTFPNHPAYCASKAALLALAKQAAVEYGPTIRINTICPGPVDTPFIHDSAAAFPDPVKAVENAGKNTLLQRLGEPEDVAKLCLFLASEDASWITGAAFTIDGGVMAKG